MIHHFEKKNKLKNWSYTVNFRTWKHLTRRSSDLLNKHACFQCGHLQSWIKQGCNLLQCHNLRISVINSILSHFKAIYTHFNKNEYHHLPWLTFDYLLKLWSLTAPFYPYYTTRLPCPREGVVPCSTLMTPSEQGIPNYQLSPTRAHYNARAL